MTTKRVLQNTRINSPVLDLGCGDGQIARKIFHNVDIIGIDIVPTKYGVVMDARKLNFPANYFGAVFSNCVLEHIQDIKTVIKQVDRVLKKKGYFIFTVPSEHFKDNLMFSWIPGYGWLRNKQLQHYNCFKQIDWEQMLWDIGFYSILTQGYITPEQGVYWDKLCWINKFNLGIKPKKPCQDLQKYAKNASARLVVAQKL